MLKTIHLVLSNLHDLRIPDSWSCVKIHRQPIMGPVFLILRWTNWSNLATWVTVDRISSQKYHFQNQTKIKTTYIVLYCLLRSLSWDNIIQKIFCFKSHSWGNSKSKKIFLFLLYKPPVREFKIFLKKEMKWKSKNAFLLFLIFLNYAWLDSHFNEIYRQPSGSVSFCKKIK